MSAATREALDAIRYLTPTQSALEDVRALVAQTIQAKKVK